ncbi:Wadjet anti-phage system protein JetD domain-containing protein [Lutibacter citreus]|uniref:Wadjet anti-phage system protein JetD domain-containing protein n=1 Tax=Lutibacter citreus TaxID=2138210 RepID=UPI000DBEA6A3|nr:Wadjet anti-phage system protein JetD domain-containing protein [Lutibacter citreus]
MISAKEIKIKAERKYKNFLQSIVEKIEIFPLVILGDKKPGKSLSNFKDEITNLIASSKEKKGFGYTITYEVRKTKLLGTQSFPSSIYFETKNDFIKFLKKEKEVDLFILLSKQTIEEFPESKPWIEKYPLKLVANISVWNNILKVCRFFKINPKPNLYIRELPIKVHTKFIENNKGIIKELLDIIIANSVNLFENDFEKRFSLKYSESLVRFKILDELISSEYFSGISDISIPVSQFSTLKIPVKRVIIVENKINLYTTLTLPNQENTIAIFGKGFQVSNIKNIEWLNEVEILYWGDLDAQGFEILSQVRGYFPKTQSILMDENTFDKFFENDLGTISKVSIELNLTEPELVIYNKLKENNWRLEQEKIPLDYVNLEFNKKEANFIQKK